MRYKKILIGLALALGLVGLLHPVAASALFNNATGEACKGVGLGSGGCSSTSTLNNTVGAVVNVLSVVVGIAAVIMIMVGGFKYITSGGDSGKATSARNTILFAVLGLVIVALAQLIVKFVVNKVT